MRGLPPWPRVPAGIAVARPRVMQTHITRMTHWSRRRFTARTILFAAIMLAVFVMLFLGLAH
jgi:hypothetical protein